MIDILEAERHIGTTVVRDDVLDARPLIQFSATVNRHGGADEAYDVVANGRHWLYFLPDCNSNGLRPDGIPQETPVLPNIPLPRRMWAGGRLQFVRPMRVGAAVQRKSVMKSVYQKQGQSGLLVFVTVEHRISGDDGLLLIEEQDYLYRDPSIGTAPARPVAPQGEWEKAIRIDLNMLFRFSAITFNAHRIHFDPNFAKQKEGYGGAIVHGPLLAIMLMDEVERRAGRKIARFSYRGVSPLIDNEPARLCGEFSDTGAKAWVCTEERGLALTAEAVF